MAIERPGLAVLSEQVLTSYDNDQKRAPHEPGAHAGVVMRLMHFIALGDFEAVTACLCDDVVFTIPATHVFFPVRSAVGRAAVIAAFRENFAVVHSQTHDLQYLVEDAANCVVIVKERGMTREGLEYEGFGVFAFAFRDGRIANILEITAAALPL